MGLASSSNRFYVDSILSYYSLTDYFDYIVAGDEVKRKKPEPDVYLKVLELSKLDSQEVIAVEDTYAGSKAAVSAGLPCVGYQNPTSGSQDLSACFLKINELHELMEMIRIRYHL
jgi:HAD superfamily hydrolase (TIGR01509 family)